MSRLASLLAQGQVDATKQILAAAANSNLNNAVPPKGNKEDYWKCKKGCCAMVSEVIGATAGDAGARRTRGCDAANFGSPFCPLCCKPLCPACKIRVAAVSISKYAETSEEESSPPSSTTFSIGAAAAAAAGRGSSKKRPTLNGGSGSSSGAPPLSVNSSSSSGSCSSKQEVVPDYDDFTVSTLGLGRLMDGGMAGEIKIHQIVAAVLYAVPAFCIQSPTGSRSEPVTTIAELPTGLPPDSRLVYTKVSTMEQHSTAFDLPSRGHVLFQLTTVYYSPPFYSPPLPPLM